MKIKEKLKDDMIYNIQARYISAIESANPEEAEKIAEEMSLDSTFDETENI